MGPRPFTLYDSTITPLKGALKSLSHILHIAEETQSDPNNNDNDTLLAARLHPTMYPLHDQIRLATQFAERVAARLTGREPTIYPSDNLTSFAALYERIEIVLKALEEADRELVNTRGQVVETMYMGVGYEPVDMQVGAWVASAAMPNIYFHVVTAYGILRAQGVELGKRDYFWGFFSKSESESEQESLPQGTSTQTV